MKTTGYRRWTIETAKAYFKSGGEDIDRRNYRSFVVCFDNGIQVAIMMNLLLSTSESLKDVVWDVFPEWYK